MKRYNVMSIPAGLGQEEPDGDWCEWKDVVGLIGMYNCLYEQNQIADKRISELEAAIADIKENQFPTRIEKITTVLNKRIAELEEKCAFEYERSYEDGLQEDYDPRLEEIKK